MSSSTNNLAVYTQRMNKVLDHIDLHLDAALDLPAMAAVAHFSPYHFHRLFAAWMGETLGDYLRRRRLDVGAGKLAARHDIPVLEVALSVGFGSGEAFARAFKLRFGCSPSDWRAATPARWAEQLAEARRRQAPQYRNLDQGLRKPDQETCGDMLNDVNSNQEDEEFNMEVKLVTLPPIKVAYMRHIGAYGPSLGVFWRETFLPWLAANDLEGVPCYGIGHDDPSITPLDKCRYDACVEVPENFAAGSKVNVTTLPGGRYAVTRFEGTGATIGDAWVKLFRDWLPASGLDCDSRPCFEYYPKDASFDPATGVFDCDLCIPVRSR